MNLTVDIALAGPGLEELFLEGASYHDALGARVPVISAEHLVVTKILAGRPKDITDVESVLVANPDLDLDVVRSLVAALEDAIGEADLSARLERTIAAARR